MTFDFEIEGLSEAIEKFRKLATPGFIQGVMVSSLLKSAFLVEGTAKQLCPVGNPEVDPNSGQLRNSISVSSIPDGAEVGSNVEYAPYVEYGTGQRGDPSVEHVTEKTSKVTGETYPYMGQAPQPYLYPALEAHRDDIKNNIVQDLDNAIKGR